MKATYSYFTLAVLLVLSSVLSVLGQDATKKTPVPTDAAQAEATKLVKELFGNGFREAKTADQKTFLAKNLLRQAQASKLKTDAATHYVLLKLARDIAAQAGDANLALQAVDDMASTYEVDMRSWTDDSGRFRIEATLVDFTNDIATLKKKGGGIVAIPIAKLDKPSQDFIASERSAKKELVGEWRGQAEVWWEDNRSGSPKRKKDSIGGHFILRVGDDGNCSLSFVGRQPIRISGAPFKIQNFRSPFSVSVGKLSTLCEPQTVNGLLKEDGTLSLVGDVRNNALHATLTKAINVTTPKNPVPAAELAPARLQRAKALRDAGQIEAYTKRLREIVKDFPGTETASEAKKLLDE